MLYRTHHNEKADLIKKEMRKFVKCKKKYDELEGHRAFYEKDSTNKEYPPDVKPRKYCKSSPTIEQRNTCTKYVNGNYNLTN